MQQAPACSCLIRNNLSAGANYSPNALAVFPPVVSASLHATPHPCPASNSSTSTSTATHELPSLQQQTDAASLALVLFRVGVALLIAWQLRSQRWLEIDRDTAAGSGEGKEEGRHAGWRSGSGDSAAAAACKPALRPPISALLPSPSPERIGGQPGLRVVRCLELRMRQPARVAAVV